MNSSAPVSTTADPAFAVDRKGVVVGWNRAAEETFGRPRAAVLGKPCWEALSGRDVWGNAYCGPTCPLMRMAAHHEAVRRCRLSFRTAGDRWQEFSVTSLVVRGGDSEGETLVHILTPPPGCADAAPAPETTLSPNSARGALTARELEVLALLARGRDTGEIAELLCISPATAVNHIQHVLHKLRVHSRLQAVVLGRRLGLI